MIPSTTRLTTLHGLCLISQTPVPVARILVKRGGSFSTREQSAPMNPGLSRDSCEQVTRMGPFRFFGIFSRRTQTQWMDRLSLWARVTCERVCSRDFVRIANRHFFALVPALHWQAPFSHRPWPLHWEGQTKRRTACAITIGSFSVPVISSVLSIAWILLRHNSSVRVARGATEAFTFSVICQDIKQWARACRTRGLDVHAWKNRRGKRNRHTRQSYLYVFHTASHLDEQQVPKHLWTHVKSWSVRDCISARLCRLLLCYSQCRRGPWIRSVGGNARLEHVSLVCLNIVSSPLLSADSRIGNHSWGHSKDRIS